MPDLFQRLDIAGTVAPVKGNNIHPADADKFARDLAALADLYGLTFHGAVTGRTARSINDGGQHTDQVFRHSTQEVAR